MLERVLSTIESISERSGHVFMWFSLLLIAAITYEVGSRYLLSSPTVWSYDLSYMLGGSLMVLGGAYTLLHEGHVRVDVIYSRLSTRNKMILDATLIVLFFFPLMTVLFRVSLESAIRSVVTQEVSSVGIWEPIMWPFRLVFPIGIGLTLLQGVAWFVRSIKTIKGGRRP